MKHRVGYNRLGRKPAHRKALHRNMVTSLFKHERIRTTKAKAREIRRTAEKMITRAKIDSVHNRRMVARDIKDKAILAKLFTDIAPRYVARPGGYTRMLKIGLRQGDASEMVLLELVEEEFEAKTSKKAKPAASEKKAATKPTEEAKEASAEAEAAPAEEAAAAEEATAETGADEAAEADQSAEEASESEPESEPDEEKE